MSIIPPSFFYLTPKFKSSFALCSGVATLSDYQPTPVDSKEEEGDSEKFYAGGSEHRFIVCCSKLIPNFHCHYASTSSKDSTVKEYRSSTIVIVKSLLLVAS